MTDVIKKKMIRTKVVKETFIETGHFLLWRPVQEDLRKGFRRCECIVAKEEVCRKCYGTGLVGGGYVRKVMPVWFRNAFFEEIESFEIKEDTTSNDENSSVNPMDDPVSMSFDCEFEGAYLFLKDDPEGKLRKNDNEKEVPRR